MNMIALEIELALERAGIGRPKSDRAVAGLDHGLDDETAQQAPGIRHRAAAGSTRAAPCSANSRWPADAGRKTPILSEFGSTSCKALWRCKACPNVRLFKCHRNVRRSALSSSRRQRSAPRSAGRSSITFAIPRSWKTITLQARPIPDLRTTMDGGEGRRSYSICYGPDDGELRIAVKKVDGGMFSNWAADKLKSGDELDVMTRRAAPACHAPGEARNYVGFAAGAASLRSCRSSRACWRASRTAASPCFTVTARQRACCLRGAGGIEGPLHSTALAVHVLRAKSRISDPARPARRRGSARAAALAGPRQASTTS